MCATFGQRRETFVKQHERYSTNWKNDWRDDLRGAFQEMMGVLVGAPPSEVEPSG